MSKNRNTNYTNRPKAQTPVINNSEVEVNTENINIEEGAVNNEDIENTVMVDSNPNNYTDDVVSEEGNEKSEIEENVEVDTVPSIENIDTVSVVEEVEAKDTIVTFDHAREECELKIEDGVRSNVPCSLEELEDMKAVMDIDLHKKTYDKMSDLEGSEVVANDMKEEEPIKDDIKNENKVYPDDKFYLILSKFVSSDKFDIIKDRLSSTEYTAFIDKYGKILVGPFDTTADAIRAKKVIVGKGLKASIL